MLPNKNILHSEELHLFKTTGQDFERMTVLQANHIVGQVNGHDICRVCGQLFVRRVSISANTMYTIAFKKLV